MKYQRGNASVIIIFVLIVIFSIYLAGGPGLLLSGESPKPEVPLTGTPGTGNPTVSPSASPSAAVSVSPTQ